MTQQLNSVVVRERNARTRARDDLTAVYRLVGHAAAFTGGVKEMQSIDDEVPDELPEITLPPMSAAKVFRRIDEILTPLWDLMATRDRSNQDARADIVVDGVTKAVGVPLPTLLSLERQLDDMRTVLRAMPVRDPSKVWTEDEDQGFHRAPEVRKPTTRKRMKPLSLAAATKEHKEQVQVVPVDSVVGHYISTDFSTAPSIVERDALVGRLNKLTDAVKMARTKANQTEATEMEIASELLGYIFAR